MKNKSYCRGDNKLIYEKYYIELFEAGKKKSKDTEEKRREIGKYRNHTFLRNHGAEDKETITGKEAMKKINIGKSAQHDGIIREDIKYMG